MPNTELKKVWAELFEGVPATLGDVKKVEAAATAFNANIDAVLKISPAKLSELIKQEDLSLEELQDIRESKLNSGADVIKGIFRCFEKGIAEEWLTEDVNVYKWMVESLGYDRLQMGGQGGIVANAMAVTGVKNVYVHCNSLPKLQSERFIKQNNLKSFDENGKEAAAYKIDRTTDIPLIHWIIEFDKNAKITVEDHEFICPKSNRFIATYDPLNLNLVMDENFVNKLTKDAMDCIVLSGFHALTAQSRGVELVEESVAVIEPWKKENTILHLELASTQDLKVRKAILDYIAPLADSLGCNERETIDVLEAIGEKELAEACEQKTNAVNLFKGLLKVKQKLKSPRIQLHMFGLYITLQNKGFKITPQANLRGMAVAATAAASKAGTGKVESREEILWSKGKQVSDVGLEEMKGLAEFLEDEEFLKTGIAIYKDYEVIALPTILIEKPITLVGMGDTISSISLIAAR